MMVSSGELWAKVSVFSNLVHPIKYFQGRDYSFMLGEMRIRPKNFQTRSGQAQTRRGGSAMEEERTKARN